MQINVYNKNVQLTIQMLHNWIKLNKMLYWILNWLELNEH